MTAASIRQVESSSLSCAQQCTACGPSQSCLCICLQVRNRISMGLVKICKWVGDRTSAFAA